MIDRISKIDYYELLKTYNFHYFPRMIGNPGQSVVSNFDEMWKKYIKWNGNSAVFNSHNGFKDIRIMTGKQMPQEIWYTSVHFDFDNPKKIENAHLDCINLSRFLDGENIPRVSVFTGGKGFQIFLLTKPHLYKYGMFKKEGHRFSNQEAIKRMTKGIQTYLKDKLELRNVDSQCMCTPKKQSRALYSWHRFTRSEDKTNCVAIPLTDEMLYEWNVEEIKEYSHNPKFIIPEVKGERYMTLREIFEYFRVNLKEQQKNVDYVEYRPMEDKVTDKATKLFLDVVDEDKPCIAYEMKNSNNPLHRMRVAFATFAKKLGMSRGKFTKIYDTIGRSIPYVDITNTEVRDQQIEWIWSNPYYKNEATCETIKTWGRCLGKKCRRYRE